MRHLQFQVSDDSRLIAVVVRSDVPITTAEYLLLMEEWLNEQKAWFQGEIMEWKKALESGRVIPFKKK